MNDVYLCIKGDAELVYGSFRNRLPSTIQSRVLAATKWCVFKPLNEPVTRDLVLRAVKERCKRLGGRADLLQFHWQDVSCLTCYDIPIFSEI